MYVCERTVLQAQVFFFDQIDLSRECHVASFLLRQIKSNQIKYIDR